ncbi:hypothetical protein FRC17_000344 [Serendipita sp. 399]|nr:hypothetical protein FRC17_000344 [Serendipita sp. 399]
MSRDLSTDSTPLDMSNQASDVLSMSATFYPREDYPGDLFIITADNVHFVVHKRILLGESNNNFRGYLVDPNTQSLSAAARRFHVTKVIPHLVPESSTLFNLILHVFYNFDPTIYKPDLSLIAELLDALPLYGVDVIRPFSEGKYFFKITLDHAPAAALDTYTLVCRHRLETLAVKCSQYLISVPLHHLTDEHCISMGPVYLRRLVFLHLGRIERLKILLKAPPASHPPSLLCDALDQRSRLEKPWREAINEICWDITADTPLSLLQGTLGPLVEKSPCSECQMAIKERIRKLFVDWTMVKNTIQAGPA